MLDHDDEHTKLAVQLRDEREEFEGVRTGVEGDEDLVDRARLAERVAAVRLAGA